MQQFEIKNHNTNMDLNMYQCGAQDCDPGHAYGPAVRDHFLIHYIVGGKGTYCFDGSVHHLEKGDGFLICPGKVTFYKADEENPWSYCWVGFHGLKAESYLKRAGLDQQNPIFRYDKDDFIKECIGQMIASQKLIKNRELQQMGFLYLFLSKITEVAEKDIYEEKRDRKEEYIKSAIEFIGTNYSRGISIREISAYVGLDRSYFCSLFKSCMNMPPQEFLINFRINKACELMKNNVLTIGDISRSVGYDDPLLFSKVFRKIKGQAPREYRKST